MAYILIWQVDPTVFSKTIRRFSHGTQDVKEGLDFYISQWLGLAMTNVDHSDFTGTKVWGRTVRLGGGILHRCWAKRCFNMDPGWIMLNLGTCSPMISCFKPHVGMFELHGEKWLFPTSRIVDAKKTWFWVKCPLCPKGGGGKTYVSMKFPIMFTMACAFWIQHFYLSICGSFSHLKSSFPVLVR